MIPSDVETTPTPRILLFSHDTFGLGHLRRSTTIARECAATLRDAAILYVTGAKDPMCFDVPPRCDVVKLPVLTKDATGRYQPGALDVTLDLAMSLRRGLVFEVMRRFDPHVVLVDHAPLGAAGELRPALEWLRVRRPGTRVLLGLRDVVDGPERVATEFGDETLASLVRRYFDRVLVYGDPRVFDPVAAYELPDDVARRVSFTGFVSGATGPEPRRAGPPRVVVASGGGADGLFVHRIVLDALAGPLAGVDARFELTLGPLSDESDRAQLLDRARRDPRVDAAVFRPGFHRDLASADVVIAMAGANTVAEILASDRPSILLPRQRPRREQALRAARLEQLGLARVVDPEHADAAAQIGALVRDALAGVLLPRMRLRPRTDGARVATERIRQELALSHESAPAAGAPESMGPERLEGGARV